MLGAIAKVRFFRDAWLDAAGLRILAQVAVRSDDNLLRAIARAIKLRIRTRATRVSAAPHARDTTTSRGERMSL